MRLGRGSWSHSVFISCSDLEAKREVRADEVCTCTCAYTCNCSIIVLHHHCISQHRASDHNLGIIMQKYVSLQKYIQCIYMYAWLYVLYPDGVSGV